MPVVKQHREPEEQAGQFGQGPGKKPPSAITWPFRRIAWTIEKYLVWPIADLFRRSDREGGASSGKGRRVLPWVAATLVVGLAAGALGAGLYLNGRDTGGAEPDEVVATVTDRPTEPGAPAIEVEPEPAALQGAAPSFGTTSGKSGAGKADTAIEPADPPKDPALKVAHRFANSFVSYEVGESRPAVLKATSTPRLARELASRPPRQPSSGKVPRARVLNVVKGEKEGRTLAVSVALQRSGAATELRLTMVKEKQDGWKVSEVLG